MLMLRNIDIDAFLAAFVLLTSFSCQYVQGDKYDEHAKLLKKLFQDYDEVSRPSPNSQYPVNVTLGIAVAQLVKVDERMEGMNLNVWYRMTWNDYRLKWNPQEHGNITNFKVDSDHLWIPDIMLTKPLSSEAGEVIGLKKSDDDLAWKISVSSDGTAAFNFPGSIYGQCSLTISDYPYDEHKCSFVFASWVHDGSELILRLRSGNALDLNNYVHNNEWHIVAAEAKAIEERYQCCPSPFYMTSFNIHVRRGASSYVSNYIIPSILIAILSIMMFTLPPEVGKRMEIGINLLLCLSVYLTILNTKMPTRSDAFPLLSKFYACCIFILTCALLCTCWVVAYYFHDMSGWEIYSMSKFVEIGILKYLRRALRFPNATKVYPSDILESVNTQRTIEVKPLTTEKTNFSGNSPAKSLNDRTKPTKVSKENKSKIPVEKLPRNVEKKEETDRKKSTNQNEDSSPQNKEQEKILTKSKVVDDRVEKQVGGDEGKADDKVKKTNAKKKVRENIDDIKPKESQAPEGETKDSTKTKKKERKKDERKNRDKSEGVEEEKIEKKPKASKEDKRAEICKESDTTTSKESDKSTRRKGDATTEKESDKSTRKESNKSKESDKSTKKESDMSASKENDKSTRKESLESTSKESNKSTRKKSDTTTGKESDKSTRKENVTAKESDTNASKENDTNSRRESDTTVSIRDSRSASRESNTSQNSKKSNNVFGSTVAPGLVEKPRKERRRTKAKTEDLGVVNLGADNEEDKSKKMEVKNRKHGNEDVTKVSNVRESPSLKDKTEEIEGDEKPNEKVSALAKMPLIIGQAAAAPDAKQDFDSKQQRAKKHDSVKLLKELSEYFSDHLERKKNRYQWRQAAIVLNRLFLIILCISIAMSVILVFLAR